tara:strand:+ start:260 stop:544 length:285 start_codon:yes stop_codon:yes gene_type:complete
MQNDDDLDLRQRMAQGNQAKDLLENPIFKKVYRILEERYVSGFSESKPEDKEVRERSYFLLQSLRKVREEMQILVSDSKLAKEKLDNLHKRKFF